MVPKSHFRLANPYAWSLALLILLALWAGTTHAQTLRVEAESYSNAYDDSAGNSFPDPVTACTYNGMDVDVSDSLDGTCKVGYVSSGEWLEYSVNVPTTGVYRLAYRYSSGNTGSIGDIVFKSGGSTLTTTSLTQGTGDWTVFTTQYSSVSLSAGTQTIRLEFSSGNAWLWDLNWFELEYVTQSVPATGETRVETENYLSAYDTSAGNSSTTPVNCTYYGQDVDIGDTTDGGGCAVGYTASGEWLEYSINVAEAATYTLRYRWASGNTGSLGTAFFKVDGSTLATTNFNDGTGGWDTYATLEASVTLSAGIQTVRLEWSNPQINMNWFSLEKSAGGGSEPGTCSFPSAGAVSVDSATVEVQGGAYIHDTPGDQLVTKNINVHADSCGSGIACTKTDTVAPVFTDVPSIPGGSAINIASSGSQTISPGDYGAVTVGFAGTLYLEPGTYTFNGNVYLNTDAKITVNAPGVAKVYINGRLDTSNNSRLNSSGASGTETLLVYTTSEIALQSATISYMVAYSKARITVQNNATQYGALTSENYVVLNYGANVYYDETMVVSSGYGSGCESSGVPTASAFWQMEQNWWDGSSGEVTDSGSAGLNGTATYDGSRPRVGRAVPAISGDPGTCHYAELTGQGYIRVNDPGSGSVLDATDFSVSAWIYPTEYPSSDVYTIMQKGQMFELHLLPSGGFRTDWFDGTNWQVFSPSGTAPLNTWSHVVYSFTNGEQKLYLNGVLQSTGSTATGYFFDDEPLVIGYDLYPNTRGFIGRIDEAGFFNYRLSASQVTALYGDTHDCSAATNYAVAQWAFDESSWAGTNGEVTDASGKGNHATAYSISGFPNTSNTFPAIAGDPGTCRYGDFYLGNDGYVSIGDSGFTDFDSYELTLSAWVMPKAMPSGSATIIRKGDQYELVVDASGIVSFRWQNNGTWNSLSAPSAIALNTWSHVAISFATGTQALYIDGIEVANSAVTKAFTLNDENIVVGYDFTAVTEAFDGFIDEVHIYANVLTATDINALSIATRSGCPSNGFEACQAIFPDGASQSTTGKVIDFYGNSFISGSPDNILDVGSIYDDGTVTCETVDCTASGSAVDQLTTPTFTSTVNVTVARNGTATINAGQHGVLTVKTDSVLTFADAGDYYVNGNFNVDTGATLNFSSEGTTRIYVNGGLFVDEGATINADGADTKYVFLYTVGNVVISQPNVVAPLTLNNMAIYSGGEIQLNSETTFTGALTAAGDIRLLQPNVSVTFDQNIIERMDFTGASCAPVPPSSNLVAEWRFDEASQWNGTANELVDSSDSSVHGTAQTSGGYPELKYSNPAQGDLTTGTCSYGDFDGSDGYFQINDPGAASVLDSTELTLAMWVYPTAYPPATLSTLITKDTHFEAHIDTSGHVKFEWYSAGIWQNVTTTETLPLNTWSHVAVTFETSSQKIYINGVLSHSDTNANAMTANDNPIALGYDLNPTSRSFEGRLDEVRVYDGVLSLSEIQTAMAETRTCDATIVPTSIDVSASTSASTCVPHSITLSIKNSLGNVITGYTGTVTLSTSTGNGDWSKTGTASDAYGTLTVGSSDSGSATYTFDSSDNGTITLLLASERTETVTISAVESVNAASGNSSAIGYTTNSFRKTDVTGGVRVVGYPQVWRVEMMAKDPSTGECSVNSSYSQTGVKAWLARGASDPGGAAPTLVDNTTSATATPPNSEPGSNNFNLTFVGGVAEFTVNTTDILQATLHIADKTRSFADVDLVMDTGEQTYGPFGFDISVTGNPAASTAGGAAFQNAGQNFTVTARAVAWQAADDSDDNKIPDNHASSGQSGRADLSDNNALVSFGQESPAETLTLSASLLLPSGGVNPGLGDGDGSAADARVLSTFVAGAASTSQVYFDEVGIMEIMAAVSDGDYLGMGGDTANSQSYSATVGRFIPASFSFGGNSLTEACQTGLDFSYLGQSFSGEFTVTPKSTQGTTLQNYTGSFIKLATGDFDFVARDLFSSTALSSRLTSSVDGLAFSGGVGTVNASFSVARGNAPDGPYTQVSLGTDFSDSDGAALITTDKDLDSNGDSTSDAAALGETELRFGRLRLANAHGPETAPLGVPMVIEYWSSPDWLVNTDDSCSEIERADINYPDGTINFSINRTVAVGSGSTTGSYSTIVGDAVQFAEGDSGLSFSAPGSGNMASFTTGVDLTNYPWLRFDWDGDGDYSDTSVPDNSVNFGSYRGHDRMIFWQEY